MAEAKKAKELQLEEQAIVPVETNLVPNAGITPMQMLQVAVEKGHGLDQIEKLMELERRWKADQAREAYYLAMASFGSARGSTMGFSVFGSRLISDASAGTGTLIAVVGLVRRFAASFEPSFEDG